MDDDDFEDLFSEADLLPGSSQESLTDAAANMSFGGSIDEEDATDFTFATHDDIDTIDCWADETCEDTQEPLHQEPNAHAIAKIEQGFEAMADAMLNDKNELSITLKVRNSKAKDQQTLAAGDSRTKRICFPGETAGEAWRFAVVLRILELMHEALRNDVVMSKRDIYYRDPALFGSQAYVDRYVDDIAFTFGLSRAALNVSAVAKGLVAGAVNFHRNDGSSTAANNDREGLLVPSLKDILAVEMKSVNWILVIEKEATFRSIAAGPFWDAIATDGIIITGKGYSDLSTRALLHFLSTASPSNGFASPPVYGLADFDPDGVSILATYKQGSKSLAHESESHCTPQLQWLGLRSQHLYTGEGDSHASQGLLKLTARDRKKAVQMLEQEGDLAVPEEWKEQLRTMLVLNTKAELQLLDATPRGMVDLLNATLKDL